MIYTETLNNGDTRYIVRVQRYGKRQVLLRTSNPYAAVHVEAESYKNYLKRIWIDGKEKSTNDYPH